MSDAFTDSLANLWNDRCFLRGWCGCHVSDVDISGSPASTSIWLDAFECALHGDHTYNFLDMDCSGKRHNGAIDTGNLAERLDESTRPMGVTHAVRALLQIVALVAIVYSILVETPTNASRNQYN